ncbi:ISNCY family transposase [Marinivivus vitaminiproducens]|uniref:ISNCY family transposase n=1 Tax=Marinivivus vitaminiproducens TaxID=3035935 RepID=UPI003F9FE1D6
MGWITMSERELQRVQVLTEVVHGRRSTVSAAHVLALSVRHTRRLLCAYREGGSVALAHKARGRPSNHRIAECVREQALALVHARYADFGPTLAAEMLAQAHGLTVSRETLRHWMIGAGLWLSRRQRRTFHQPRRRREAYGELVQIDGSEHRWFEDRADPCTLLVFIDDATGRLMQLRFVRSESAFTYFDILQGYLDAHGLPVAFYSDKHSVFRVARQDGPGGQGMTQFGRALAELNIEILCANSSEAKGRVERVNRTLQDRLVKELRLAGISDMEAGNAYLAGFIDRFNTRFSIAPAVATNAHRPLNLTPDRLRLILCRREQRYVGRQLALSYERKRIILQPNDVTARLEGKHVDIYAFADGRIDVRWRGASLPYTVFDKDQRVTHTAIVENKRLGDVLAFIKQQQETPVPPRVKTNSERVGYRKTGRKRSGRKGIATVTTARTRPFGTETRL